MERVLTINAAAKGHAITNRVYNQAQCRHKWTFLGIKMTVIVPTATAMSLCLVIYQKLTIIVILIHAKVFIL